MAKTKELTPLDKKNWTASFNLVGVVKLNQNTFQLDAVSQKSDWQYSRMNLAVDCGPKSGVNYCSLMGGFSTSRDNVIYKFVDGETTQIDWEDRFDEEILKTIPDYQKITIGIEKDSKGKTFYHSYLSEYDAIADLAEHLVDGSVVNVRGNIVYREYNGSITMDRNVTSIALSSATEDKYRATFTQTVLVGDDAVGKADKETMTIPVQCYVLEKLRSFNGYDLTDNGKNRSGQFVPLSKEFEYAFPQDPDKAKKAISFLFVPKRKGTVTQLTMEGRFESGGGVVAATYDDLNDDVRELISLGIITEEDALASVAVNAPRTHRMTFVKPRIRNITNADGTTTSTPQIFREKYKQEDIDELFFMKPHEDIDGAMNPPEDEETTPFDEDKDSDSGDSDDWLNDLG